MTGHERTDDTGGGVQVDETVTVSRPSAQCYRFWRDVENLPSIAPNLESVSAVGEGRSHWVVRGPGGTRYEWDAEIVEDQPDRVLAWRSVEGAQVRNAGRVRFEPAPGGRGTEVRVRLSYDPPGGRVGARLARLTGKEPAQQVRDGLRRFRQFMETGEIVAVEGQPSGRGRSRRTEEREDRA